MPASVYPVSSAFIDAMNYVSSTSPSNPVSNDIKLELYGLYKSLTTASRPNILRPSLFDFSGRAKWDAWERVGRQYEGREEEGEARYLTIARGLGWTPLGLNNPDDLSSDRISVASLLSVSSTARGRGDDGGGGGEGMGVSVSAVARPKEDSRQEETLHGFALTNDIEGLARLMHDGHALDGLDDMGYTPMHLACDRGSIDAVKFLLQHKVNVHIKDEDDLTALELAEIAGHDDIVRLIKEG